MIKWILNICIKNEYMKCVLQINGFSGPRPRVYSSHRVRLRERGRGRDIYFDIRAMV